MSVNPNDSEIEAINKKKLEDMAKAAGAKKQPTEEERANQQFQIFLNSLDMQFAAIVGQATQKISMGHEHTKQNLIQVFLSVNQELALARKTITDLEAELHIWRSGGKPDNPKGARIVKKG